MLTPLQKLNPKRRLFQKDIFITWKRLILYQEFNRASFQSPFWREIEEFSIFWLKSWVNPFAKTDFLKIILFITWKRLILYQEFKPNIISKPILKKNKERGILWLKSWVNPLQKQNPKWRLFKKNDTFYNLTKAYFISRI